MIHINCYWIKQNFLYCFVNIISASGNILYSYYKSGIFVNDFPEYISCSYFNVILHIWGCQIRFYNSKDYYPYILHRHFSLAFSCGLNAIFLYDWSEGCWIWKVFCFGKSKCVLEILVMDKENCRKWTTLLTKTWISLGSVHMLCEVVDKAAESLNNDQNFQ